MRKFLAELALLLTFASGCARTQCFRTVDAQTGAPLGGVVVEQLGSAMKPGTTTRTETSGMAELKGVGGRFTFRKEGYFETQAEANQSGAKVTSGEDRRQQNVERHAGIVQVPLVRNPADPGLQVGQNSAGPSLR
jgi:hypothetical protein